MICERYIHKNIYVHEYVTVLHFVRRMYVRFCYFNVNVAGRIRAYKDSKSKHVVTVIPKGE